MPDAVLILEDDPERVARMLAWLERPARVCAFSLEGKEGDFKAVVEKLDEPIRLMERRLNPAS